VIIGNYGPDIEGGHHLGSNRTEHGRPRRCTSTSPHQDTEDEVLASSSVHKALDRTVGCFRSNSLGRSGLLPQSLRLARAPAKRMTLRKRSVFARPLRST
jgi:hypothetical protein